MPQAVQDPPLPPGFKLNTGKAAQPDTDEPPLPPGYHVNNVAVNPTQAIVDAQAQKYPGPVPDPLAPDWNTPWHAVKGAGRGVAGLVMGVPRLLSQMGKEGSYTAPILNPMRAEAAKSDAANTSSEAFGHKLASIIPLIGPWAAGIGERAASGDIAGAGTEAATTIGIPALARAGAEALPPAAPKISGALSKAAEANRAPLPKSSVLDLNELAAKGVIGAAGGGLGTVIGSILGHPQLGASTGATLAEAMDLIRRTPTYRNLKASAQESLAKEVTDIGSALQAPEPMPVSGGRSGLPENEFQQPGMVRASNQGWTGGPRTAESPPIDVEHAPVAPQGMLTSRGQQLALPAAPSGPPQLQGGPTALAPATDAVPITPDPRLPAAYRLPVEAPAPPGIMGQANLGAPGPIPAHGEQTVTPVKAGLARNDLGQFRRMTREEALQAKGTAGRTASNPEPPTPPRKGVKK